MGETGVAIDESRFPIVVLELRGELTDGDFSEMFRAIEEILARGERFVLVTDLRRMSAVANARQRQDMIERAAELERKYPDVRVASVRIIQSRLVRGGLTAFNWVRGRAHRELCASDMQGALEVAGRVAEDNGIVVPEQPARHG